MATALRAKVDHMSAIERSKDFPLTEARNLVKDLSGPDPLIYWVDYLLSITIGWSAFVLAVRVPDLSLWQVTFYVIASLALYRAVIFTHELAHLKKGTFKFFRLIWNLTCGFLMMVPSFTYHGVHNDHHKRNVYGTRRDGEYLPFGVQEPYWILAYLCLTFVLPLLFAVRFIVLTPLSYINRGLRRLVWQRLSSLTIDFSYRRPPPGNADDPTWPWQEFITFIYGITVIGLVVSGVLPLKVLILWYMVSLLIFFLNALRTLAAHAYRNPGYQVLTVPEQFLDSVNVPGNLLLTALWAPVGLRYHATHHLFPNLPYHVLGKAHRLLVAELPDNTLYLKTERKSLSSALRMLWQEARLSKLQNVEVEAG